MAAVQGKTHFLRLEPLERFMHDVFVGLGVPEADAAVCAEVLITADRYGIDSHGISRCKPIYYDRIKLGILSPVTELEIVKETETTAVIDGHNGMGHAIAKRAMQMAIDKARAYGLGMTAVRNSSHYGIAGYYALMAIENGMIGMTGTNARPSIAPTFGVENMLGTNPLTIGCPTDDPFPFLLDCATSVTQRGKIELLARAGREMPSGWVVDHDGRSPTDSIRTLKDLVAGTAALVPLGGLGETTAGYKGYGFATFVEILSAALQDGRCLKQLNGTEDGRPIPYRLGHFFLAIDIAHFVPLELFRGIAGSITRALRGSEKAPGAERIYTAWEKEHERSVERAARGVPIEPSLQAEMDAMRAELGLEAHAFPWD
ncbi:MAG: Ldh family oxidoreductase [Proteobacteria bacterium]|jgi:LDH2 family malate/lactate/ureidoglycolate dehydrogenase|nr:Ldh family oxidoreductase [Pseudomonadota bacterium]